jgi:hypothetical protein
MRKEHDCENLEQLLGRLTGKDYPQFALERE